MDPIQISSTIEASIEKLRERNYTLLWRTWKDLKIAGQIIFCTICKACRFSKYIISDVTTLNFNLLFEIGFALGLELPVIPIRDTSFIRDTKDFEEFGLLDTLGYVDFQNSDELSKAIFDRLPVDAIPIPPSEINFDAPLYVVKGSYNIEGEIHLMSTLKKSAVRFRTFDIYETPRLSLHEIRKQIASSLGLITHLLSPERKGAVVHNARCALMAGMAMASRKTVLMLQECRVKQPIDYREVVVSYENPSQVPHLVEPIILRIIRLLQSRQMRKVHPSDKLLHKLNLGDLAAENEISQLQRYFVETGQYYEAKRGNARLVIGRKGSGKTAIFYSVRDSISPSHSWIVLDLKPEGHQFTKLREMVISKLSPGLQEHTMTAFWNFILLSEIAHKIVEDEYSWAQRDPNRWQNYCTVQELYKKCGFAEKGDFSERLLTQVQRVGERFGNIEGDIRSKNITEILYSGAIRKLDDIIAKYLEEKNDVLLLVDNLDKGWPTRGSTSEDILILRTLLEATRKLQRQLEKRNVNFHCLIFLRNDIYDHLISETPDRGKDTAMILDWSDRELFKEIFRKRAVVSGLPERSFDEVWSTIFEPHIGTQDSFSYVVERTLMRPRDFLSFIHRAIEVAINRGHERVIQNDLQQAEKIYSDDILQTTVFELKDVFSGVGDFLYVFLGCHAKLTKEVVFELLRQSELQDDKLQDALELLAWFGFLGVESSSYDAPRYAYEIRYNLTKLLAPINTGGGRFVIHPAFRSALECEKDN